GKYGFMSVYRDDPYPPHDTTDDGAEPGDTIRFFVNGIEAIATGNTVWTESGDSWEVCLEAGLIVTKYCDLMEGWNLVSWNVDHESNYILDVLQSIDTCLELVMGFEQGGLTYDPDLPEFSTLWYVDHLSGYWIKTSCPVTLEITGAPVPATTPIPVTAGWNLVSYLPDFALTTEDALASLLDNDNLIVALGFDGEGLIYLPNGNDYNTLDTMGPCFGYWLKVWADDDLVYPGVGPIIASSQKGQHPVSLASTATDLTPTSHWINLYGRNLTLDGKTVPAGATVTAHALDGTKIGSFTLNQDGLFGFMPVYADDPATSEIEGIKAGERFYLAIDGNATNENFVWTQTGDKIEVESLTAKAGSDQVLPDGYSLHQNYPNPFNPTTTISFTLPVSGKAKVEIFNILGALVATPFDGVAQAGTNEVVWDGRNSAGEIVSSGIYLYRLTADKYTETKKMTMLK
ncbi:MAG: T9SS type A sorting domain-containing protein, partial [Candidatus Zixiibacteriota bacterium]